MIVDPDFPDHWKTRMLVDALDGDEAAPVYLLRLWAHCQNRRTAAFENLPQAALKALCRFPGHPNKLESSLAASGFVRREDQILIVVGWEEYNASLIANWENGKRGGRPPKITHGLPMGNPSVTHGEPIRVDEIGLDVKREEPPNPLLGAGEGDKSPSVLPKGWQQMSATQRKQARVNVNSKAMNRIGKMLGRRDGTLWTVAEAVALKTVNPQAEEIELMEVYYLAPIDREKDYRRRDLLTLLNNWTGELDRARIFKSNQ